MGNYYRVDFYCSFQHKYIFSKILKEKTRLRQRCTGRLKPFGLIFSPSIYKATERFPRAGELPVRRGPWNDWWCYE